MVRKFEYSPQIKGIENSVRKILRRDFMSYVESRGEEIIWEDFIEKSLFEIFRRGNFISGGDVRLPFGGSKELEISIKYGNNVVYSRLCDFPAPEIYRQGGWESQLHHLAEKH